MDDASPEELARKLVELPAEKKLFAAAELIKGAQGAHHIKIAVKLARQAADELEMRAWTQFAKRKVSR